MISSRRVKLAGDIACLRSRPKLRSWTFEAALCTRIINADPQSSGRGSPTSRLRSRSGGSPMPVQDVSKAPTDGEDARQPGATPTSLVGLRGVSKSFGGVTVLSDVDLAVRPGEVVAVIGPS